MSNDLLNNELLLPAGTENHLERPAVDALIKNALLKPLTTVIANAGYGKTQSVFSVLRSIEYRSAWLQLSELDNVISRFWERFAFACKLYSSKLAESLLALGYPESIAHFDRFIRMLEKEIGDGNRLVFVFDDFHHIHNKAIHSFLELLIHARMKNFSIVLISRTKPCLSLADMQSRGLLACITEEDLRFSEDEMEAYFQQQDIELDDKVLSSIYSFTNGWVIAIYLVGLAAKKGSLNGKNPTLEARINIFDLMENEIFGQASKKLQDFLINISVLDEMPYGLFKELVCNDFTLIAEMAQISMFVRYDPLTDRYRIHQLLKDFLIERKNRLTEEEIADMHVTAAKWYEKNGYIFETLDHYKECGYYDEIFDIVLSFTRHVSKETADLFMQLIEEAPDELIRERPIIRVAKTKYMFNNNRIEEARLELLDMQKEFEALTETKENRAVLGEVYVMLALIGIVTFDYKFEWFFKMADKCLPNGSTLFDIESSIAESLNVCSIKNPSSNELKKHQDVLFRVAPYAVRVMNGCGYGLEYLNAAESGLYMGDLLAAEKYAYEAIYRARQYLQHDIECMANFILVRVFTAKGNYAGIVDILDRMKNQLESLRISDCISLYEIIEGWFYVKIGKPDQVASWLKSEETRKLFTPIVLGREYFVRSDCMLAEERYAELLAFIEQTDKIYEDRGILFANLQNKITKAIICHYVGSYAESIKMLNDAYELAYSNNLVMQYIEYGNKMRNLTLAAKRNKDCKIPSEWLDKIYSKSTLYSKHLTHIALSYDKSHGLNDQQVKLTRREKEALAYLCRGLTRKEIADSCYLSIGTVDDILKKIYDKLGASNAADAVWLAKEKNLV